MQGRRAGGWAGLTLLHSPLGATSCACLTGRIDGRERDSLAFRVALLLHHLCLVDCTAGPAIQAETASSVSSPNLTDPSNTLSIVSQSARPSQGLRWVQYWFPRLHFHFLCVGPLISGEPQDSPHFYPPTFSVRQDIKNVRRFGPDVARWTS